MPKLTPEIEKELREKWEAATTRPGAPPHWKYGMSPEEFSGTFYRHMPAILDALAELRRERDKIGILLSKEQHQRINIEAERDAAMKVVLRIRNPMTQLGILETRSHVGALRRDFPHLFAKTKGGS